MQEQMQELDKLAGERQIVVMRVTFNEDERKVTLVPLRITTLNEFKAAPIPSNWEAFATGKLKGTITLEDLRPGGGGHITLDDGSVVLELKDDGAPFGAGRSLDIGSGAVDATSAEAIRAMLARAANVQVTIPASNETVSIIERLLTETNELLPVRMKDDGTMEIQVSTPRDELQYAVGMSGIATAGKFGLASNKPFTIKVNVGGMEIGSFSSGVTVVEKISDTAQYAIDGALVTTEVKNKSVEFIFPILLHVSDDVTFADKQFAVIDGERGRGSITTYDGYPAHDEAPLLNRLVVRIYKDGSAKLYHKGKVVAEFATTEELLNYDLSKVDPKYGGSIANGIIEKGFLGASSKVSKLMEEAEKGTVVNFRDKTLDLTPFKHLKRAIDKAYEAKAATLRNAERKEESNSNKMRVE